MCDDNSVEKHIKQKIKYKDNTETDEKTINLPYNKKNVFITEKGKEFYNNIYIYIL